MDPYNPDDPRRLIRSKINFHLVARHIALERGHVLSAIVSWEGNLRLVTLDLDRYIGISDGVLVWGSQYFSWSSTRIELSRCTYGWCPTLYATSTDSRGRAQRSALNLAQCIGIENGHLVCHPDVRFVVNPVVNERQAVLYYEVPYLTEG